MHHLGISLLELGLWKRFKNTKSSGLERVFAEQNCADLPDGPEYQRKVIYCLGFEKNPDSTLSEPDFRATFYKRVISPLKQLASYTTVKEESFISL